MVCRTNPASSVIMALARDGSWLDDAQVQSIVHRLRHEYSQHSVPQGWDRDEVASRELDRAERAISLNPNLRPQRRAGLRARVARARSETGGLDQGVLWAMTRLQDGVAEGQAALDARLGEIAGQQGMSRREARAQFLSLRAQAPGGRQARASDPELRDLGAIPGDPATRHALRALSAGDPVLPPVRLVQQWLPVGADDSGVDEITHIGVSTLSDRVEIRRRDGSTAAYRVSREHIDALLGQARQRPLGQGSGGWVEARGTRIPRAEQTAFAVRCDECGQFVGDRWHDCPSRGPVALVPQRQHVDGESRLAAPDPRAVADLIAANHDRPVQAPIRYITSEAEVTGTVLLRPGLAAVRGLDRTTRQRVDLDDAGDDELTCLTCYSVNCRHVAHAREAVRGHMSAAGDLPQAEVSAALHALGISVRPRGETTVATAAAAPAVVSFLSNPEAFRQTIRDTGRNREVPFHTENALQGYAAGARFGIELEFNADSHAVPSEVGRELHARGLLASPRRAGYHTGSRSGYNAWVFESDGSVRGGELVTPVLSDTREHWAQVQAACDAVRRHGGTTEYAGSHTNISSAGYTPEMAWRLVNLLRANEDDIYRMGRTRRSARLSAYNRPLPSRDPGPAWQHSHEPVQYQGGREAMINFHNAFQSSSGRIEFRFPDASHDPGVIQAQVSLCAAMTGYVRTNDVQPSGHRPLHTARSQGWARNLMTASETEFEERTRPIRTLIDTLFTTQQDRRQIAALWGRGSYYRDR